jgi:predicted NBD/HSP70 family sugar kinase
LDRWRSTGATFEGTGWQALGSLLDSAVTDATATSIVDDAIEALGAGLGSIINLTNPQRVVVGGWVGIRLFERYAERIHDATRRNCLARLADQFELVSATFGGDTVALGSALMPIEALINAPRMA